MNISSLMQLEKCNLLALEVRYNPDAPVSPERSERAAKQESIANLTFTSEIRSHQSGLLFRVTLGIEASWPEEPEARFEKISATIDGVFSFPEGTEQDEIKTYVPVLCLTNLYGVARGIISQATGACPGGAYYLPLVNMNEVARRLGEEPVKTQQAKRKPKTKKSASKRVTRKRKPKPK